MGRNRQLQRQSFALRVKRLPGSEAKQIADKAIVVKNIRKNIYPNLSDCHLSNFPFVSLAQNGLHI